MKFHIHKPISCGRFSVFTQCNANPSKEYHLMTLLCVVVFVYYHRKITISFIVSVFIRMFKIFSKKKESSDESSIEIAIFLLSPTNFTLLHSHCYCFKSFFICFSFSHCESNSRVFFSIVLRIEPLFYVGIEAIFYNESGFLFDKVRQNIQSVEFLTVRERNIIDDVSEMVTQLFVHT